MSNNLEGWNTQEQQQRADFIEHIYQCYKPSNHLYTGLWKRFCLEEAGPYCRNMFFERIDGLQKFIEGQEKTTKES